MESSAVPPLVSFDYMKTMHQLTPSSPVIENRKDKSKMEKENLSPSSSVHDDDSNASEERKRKSIRTRRKIKSSDKQNHTTMTPIDIDYMQSPSKNTASSSQLQSIVQIPAKCCAKTILNKMVQKFLSIPITIGIFLIIKKIFLHHQELEYFFTWMEQHPNKGMAAYLIIYPFHMVLFLPGTPLVMGAGYIFKIRFGWLWGVSLCSIITLFGSLIGSIQCFLLGRYCMRSSVRRWSKKYPLFEPIDAAVSVNSFKIMSLLYLTPVIPLGPLSYVMGTTSMPLMSFAKAKIAALPLTVLYVYLGAATGTLVAEADENVDPNQKSKGMGELKVDPKLIVLGILCSIGSIALISIKMKAELQKILDQQKNDDEITKAINDDQVGKVNSRREVNVTGQTRKRVHIKAPRITESSVEDIEIQRPTVV